MKLNVILLNIDWLIFIEARNKRTCNEYNNSDNESDTWGKNGWKLRTGVWKYLTKQQFQLRRLNAMFADVYVAYCSSYSRFRCRMGLCLRRSAYCNGTVECPDGSDEPANCRSKLFWLLRL